MDLRSRVSTSLAGQTFARKRSGQPDYICEYHLYGPKPYIDKMKKLVDSDTLNVWPCIDTVTHSSLNILARGHRAL